jgi:hypothetical protein
MLTALSEGKKRLLFFLINVISAGGGCAAEV